MGWSDYFERRPIGWREDDRTFKLMQVSSFSKLDKRPEEIFPTLGVIYAAVKSSVQNGKTDPEAFMRSGLFQKIMSAKGGDRLNYDKG